MTTSASRPITPRQQFLAACRPGRRVLLFAPNCPGGAERTVEAVRSRDIVFVRADGLTSYLPIPKASDVTRPDPAAEEWQIASAGGFSLRYRFEAA